MRRLAIAVLIALFSHPAPIWAAADVRAEVAEFLAIYNAVLQPVSAAANEADWQASTNVSDENTGRRIGANEVRARFVGNAHVIQQTRRFLAQKGSLDEKTVRELEAILLNASSYPGTVPELVSRRVAAEAKQSAIQDGFTFKLTRPETGQEDNVTPNQIDEILEKSNDLAERKAAWLSAKSVGIPLKPGLLDLQQLRNDLAREMSFSSFFALQVADYGMSVDEMRQLTERLNQELKPLYEQLHCWAKHKLAARFNQPVPKLIPAHWLGNRWGQEWPGLVEALDLDPMFKQKKPEWLVEQAERFYTSLGWPKLPPVFWDKSDLYELPAGAARKKNTHASAWHIDLNHDVRSLMSVRPNFRWHETTHHELGHIYYFLAYSNPDVPLSLREGANRAFHEAIGDVIGIAARQVPYLKQIGILEQNLQLNATQYLLNEALDNAVVFLPWSAGVMTMWEHDFYEKQLPPDQLNHRWWHYVATYQGIAPPENRPENFCDPATKTHVNDDPAQYYDYALAYIIKYQLHMHIAKNILRQDPHSCSYYGNKEVGEFLWKILRVGKTRDWRQLLRENLGQEISAKPMLEYFQPLTAFLQKENTGRDIAWK